MTPNGLMRSAANGAALTPVDFLDWTAATYPNVTAIIHGQQRWTYAEMRALVRQLAAQLAARGIKAGDTVSAILPNTPPMVLLHYAVPMLGAVLNTLNTRLDAATIAFQLRHGDAKLLIVDSDFSALGAAALAQLETPPAVIDVRDPLAHAPGPRLSDTEFDAWVAGGDPTFAVPAIEDEWSPMALNYTSGTTGDPKGVVYHHRGAYLNAVNNAVVWSMPRHPAYLWTLPMFHCNGWCFPWTITLQAGTHVCLRRVEATAMYQAIADYGVTHLCGAPIVMNMLLHAKPEERRALPHKVELMTAAAPPPAAVIQAMEAQGFSITHVYGLTEVYGPVVYCAWKREWDDLPVEERARLKARQGVRYQLQAGLMVADPDTLEPVPADGKTLGEVFIRGNITMLGYLKNPAATEKAFSGGWFHTGDLAVLDADGYIALKDRSKDIIISGGENISTIEVEGVLYAHPAVLEAAVVARPDEKWGETPCAFITLKDGGQATEAEIIAHCRAHLASFKVPKTIVFGSLPKTSTGKVQKFLLRDQARRFSARHARRRRREGGRAPELRWAETRIARETEPQSAKPTHTRPPAQCG
ncbi:acyl-CoA synthetase [Elstera litoralis]|uniref:acyl-CoA synthetase n=1 Tax=Elstera litoralis TaxID=552518 RepID=UPI0009FF9FB6|nr:acyl-CoA synthetase [Elstera litoralis]